MNKRDSSSDITIFIILFISSLEIVNTVTPDPNIFLRIAACVIIAAAINPNNIKTLLANGLRTFPIKGNPVFCNGAKSLPKNSPDYPILCNWAFDSFILADELFEKALRSLETCAWINDNLWRKLSSSLELSTIFDEIFLMLIFWILNWTILRLKCCAESFYTDNILK